MIASTFNDKPLPVYGEGINVRDWLYVEGYYKAIDLIIHNELDWLLKTKFADGLKNAIK